MSPQLALEPVFKTWRSFEKASGISHIESDADYTEAFKLADALVDNGAMDGKPPPAFAFMMIAELIYAYDQRHYPSPHIQGSEMLRFLMN